MKTPSRSLGDSGDDATHPLDTDWGLCLNEVMAANRSVIRRDDGSTPDWIEIFNPSDEDISLGGFTVSDDREDRFEHVLSDELVVPAGFGLVLYAVGDDDSGVELDADELPFRLSSTGGEVAFFEPDGDGQVIAYGALSSDFSIIRTTDCCTGEGCLDHQFRGSPGFSND